MNRIHILFRFIHYFVSTFFDLKLWLLYSSLELVNAIILKNRRITESRCALHEAVASYHPAEEKILTT